MRRIIHTPQTDEIIRKAYTGKNFGKTALQRSSQLTGFSRGTVSRRAVLLGVSKVTRKACIRWTKEEEDFLESIVYKELDTIRRELVRKGFESRSLMSIKQKIKLLGLGQAEARIDNGIYSANQLALLSGVSPNVVLRWCKLGLKHKIRSDAQNEHVIKAKDVLVFFKNNLPMVDTTKVDKFWYFDLLTGAVR